MKERMDKLTAVLAEDSKMTKLEVVLSILLALISGILLGILFFTRKHSDDCEGCDCDNCGECECEGGLCCQEDCDEERCCGEREFCGNKELCCKDDFSGEIADTDDDKIKIAEEAAMDTEEEKSYVKIR